MKTARDTQPPYQTTASKLRKTLLRRKKNPNLLTKIVDRAYKLFGVVFGNRKPSETTREEGQHGISAATGISDLEQVLEEEIASPVELAKAYMGSRPSKAALRQDLGITSSYGREEALTSSQSSAFQHGGKMCFYALCLDLKRKSSILDNDIGSGGPLRRTRQKGNLALKRRSSVLDDDIGSGGPLRRIRQKANLLMLRDKRELGYTALQQPDHASHKLLLMNESELKIVKGAEKIETQACMALRSLEKVDSPKLLSYPHDNQKSEVQHHERLHDSRELTSKGKEKFEENGPKKFLMEKVLGHKFPSIVQGPRVKECRTRFELDMLLESVNSALKRVEELLNGIKNHSVSSEGSIHVEDHFSALNLRCIERLYGDRGLEVIETLRKCPSTAQDSKDLSTKCLVAEIKETKEKSRKDDDVLYSVAAGSRHSIVCLLLKNSESKYCSNWTTFLEPMLYVPSRPENSDNVKDVEISTCGATTNEGDSDGSLGANSVTFNNVKQAPAVGVVNDNVLPRSSTELSRRDPTPRPRNVHDDGHEAKSNIDDVPSSQQGDTSRTPPVANTNFAKFEKEEGELSPNVYFDEAYFATYGDHNGSNAKEKHSMEIDADADEEDTKNVLENGKIIKMETVMILMVKQKAKERPRG
ncbi:hypothetical protein Tco_1153559 [Tanacetum coccineum]